MPFDSTHQIDCNRSVLSELLKQADDAFSEHDYTECVSYIEEIYSLFDSASGERFGGIDRKKQKLAIRHSSSVLRAEPISRVVANRR